MNKLSLVLVLIMLSGCGSAQLISTRYKPKKMGTIKLDIPGPAQRGMVIAQGDEIMAKFCAPQKPEIIGTDSLSEVDGLYASPFQKGVVNYGYKDSPLIHFECVDSASERIPSSH